SVRANAVLFELADLAVDFLERFFQRLDQIVDRVLFAFEFALRVLLKRFEVLLREIEKRLVIVAECVGGERFERVGKLDFGVVQERDLFLVCFAFLFETRLQHGALSFTVRAAAIEFVLQFGSRNEPEGSGADGQTNSQHRHGEDNFHRTDSATKRRKKHKIKYTRARRAQYVALWLSSEARDHALVDLAGDAHVVEVVFADEIELAGL